MISEKIQRKGLVLVVEDQEINQGILGSILEDEYDVLYADNGAEGLEQMRQHKGELSIVLLDLIMPVMDGYEVLRRVRLDPELARIPIIVLTAEKNAELEALELGAADFITKPFEIHEIILARVAKLVELTESHRLIQATEYDPVSNLYTRGFFHEYAEKLQRYQPEAVMDVLALNIDHFHSINDMNGREFGDRLLRVLGEEIRAFLKENEGIASRFAADHFLIYCRRPASYAAAQERFQEALSAVNRRVSIHVRMGVCPWAEGLSVNTMFDRAMTACTMVRGNFLHSLMVYDEKIHEKELFDQRLLNDLQQALAEHQFLVYFQPKYKIQTDTPQLSSAEALVRWKHPELGMVSPGSFIPLFEKNGLIHLVDLYVWEEAARQVGEWKRQTGTALPVSVNLSRAEIFDPELESTLLGLLERNGLEPGDLKLEVTESAYTDNADQLIARVHQLRDLGFEIEMDDFGSGYSSLNMISSLPIDVLKMDMKFIQNIEKNDRDFRLVEVVLDIADYLGVPVVAEGVETDRQLALLREAGCELVQGYYFSRPLPAEDFTRLLLRARSETQHKEGSV